jgi:hypothetical protein
MYENEDDGYGNEDEEEDDRNDGLNALVKYNHLKLFLEFAMGYWLQQRHRLRSS